MYPEVIDRYVSFEGLDCDVRAADVVERLHRLLTRSLASDAYHGYFTRKLMEKAQRNQDDLHFVHSQINVLFDFFKGRGDTQGMRLLERIEVDCC